MTDFLIFYAPLLVVIVGIVLAFWWAPKDKHAVKNGQESRK